nr:DDE-type integrase/transposase/recombinase [Paraburkholderia sp. HP33-1]
MKKTSSLYHGHRFPAVVFSRAVRWYFRFSLILRDIEELLLEWGVTVIYESIRCSGDRFGAPFARREKTARHRPGSTWHLDELSVSFRGEPFVLWCTADEHGAELGVLLQQRRDEDPAKRLFKRVLHSAPVSSSIEAYAVSAIDSHRLNCTSKVGHRSNLWVFFMTKYSEQFKLKMVKQRLADVAGTEMLARQHGVGRSVFPARASAYESQSVLRSAPSIIGSCRTNGR